MIRAFQDGTAVGEGGIRLNQVRRGVHRATDLAGISILVLGMTFGTLALDVAVGQEHALDWVKKLFDRSRFNQAFGAQLAVDILRQLVVFCRVRRVPVVKGNVKAVEVLRAFGGVARHQCLRGDALGLGLEHDGGAMGVVSTHEMHRVASHAHGADPNVGLDVLHDVANVKGAVGVRQGGRDEQGAGHGSGRVGSKA